MIKHQPESFQRDLKLFRGFSVLLAFLCFCFAGYIYMATDCSPLEGVLGTLAQDFCLLLGTKVTALGLFAYGIFLIRYPFSSKGEQRLQRVRRYFS